MNNFLTIFTIALSYVTFGSLIKLRHKSLGCRLHSHEVAYGSGSKQQSVTCVDMGDDPNSFWIIKEAHGSKSNLIQG